MKNRRALALRRCAPAIRGHVGPCTGRRSVRYGECQKNYAASIGGHAVDGCREFMADGEEGTGGALRCAACSCHRSFHRRVQDNGGAATARRRPLQGSRVQLCYMSVV